MNTIFEYNMLLLDELYVVEGYMYGSTYLHIVFPHKFTKITAIYGYFASYSASR